MIDEQVLERLLHEEAATYDVPAGGPATVLEAAAEDEDRRPHRGWWAAAAAAAVVALAGVGASNVRLPLGDDVAQSAREYTAYNSDSDRGYVTTTGSGAGAGGGIVDPGAKPVQDSDGAAVVRTGDTWLEVSEARVDDTVAEVTRVARTHGGYVAESRAQSGDDASGFVTIRVPAGRFDQAVADVARLGRVRHASTSGEDVSAQVTDTAARLKSAIATRAQLRTLLARATSVGDVLAVQERMSEVQTEIEKLEATRKDLADRTSFASLGVTVSPPGGHEDREGFAKAWHDAVDGFVGGFQGLLAASGTIAFALLVGAVLFLVARRAYRYWVRGVV